MKLLPVLCAFLLTILPMIARSSSSHSTSRAKSSSSSASRTKSSSAPSNSVSHAKSSTSSRKCASCARTSRGKIKRSTIAKRRFEKSHPCPSTGRSSGVCPGYVVDHIKPLKRGGADSPSNMQWQTKEAAKTKDRTED